MIVSWIKLYWMFWNSFILLHFELNYYVQWLNDPPITFLKKNEDWHFCYHQITNFKLQMAPHLLLGNVIGSPLKFLHEKAFLLYWVPEIIFYYFMLLNFSTIHWLLGIAIVSKVWRRSRVNTFFNFSNIHWTKNEVFHYGFSKCGQIRSFLRWFLCISEIALATII